MFMAQISCSHGARGFGFAYFHGAVARARVRLSALLLPRAAEIAHEDPARAVALGLRLVVGMLEQAILFGERGVVGIPVSDEKLAAELTHAFLGYLGVDGRRDAVT